MKKYEVEMKEIILKVLVGLVILWIIFFKVLVERVSVEKSVGYNILEWNKYIFMN